MAAVGFGEARVSEDICVYCMRTKHVTRVANIYCRECGRGYCSREHKHSDRRHRKTEHLTEKLALSVDATQNAFFAMGNFLTIITADAEKLRNHKKQFSIVVYLGHMGRGNAMRAAEIVLVIDQIQAEEKKNNSIIYSFEAVLKKIFELSQNPSDLQKIPEQIPQLIALKKELLESNIRLFELFVPILRADNPDSALTKEFSESLAFCRTQVIT